jgi:CRISPR-associated protein Csm5
MNRFTEIVPLVLTPLTPIHIGCGEDFEPTNYVIDGGVLYPFEPAALRLNNKDRLLLMQSSNRPGIDAILAVQQFFHRRRDDCRAASPRAIPVATGIVDWYEGRIGRVVQREGGGRRVGNELGIERTSHHPYTGEPYLPGSSIKGSARTGWLNDVDREPPRPRDRQRSPARDESTQLENQILGGSFSSDPFRLVEFADAAGADLKSRVFFAVDRRKRSRPDGEEKDLAVAREAIAGGQFRAAQGEIRFKARPVSADPRHAPRAEKCIDDFAALARACNRFYGSRLAADLEVLTALGEVQWTEAFQSLTAVLKPALDDGGAMLLRVGRHSGAEGVTLDRHRWIRIMEGRGQAHWARDATTIWLAADREDVRANLRPFGWLLLERADDLPDGDHLYRWCEQERNTSTAPSGAGEAPLIALARADAGSSATAGRPSASRAQAAPGSLVFRRGDRVRNTEGEIGIVMSDVMIGESTMTIEIDGDLETVRVTEWRTARS